MLKYIPNGRGRLGRPLNGLQDETETGLGSEFYIRGSVHRNSILIRSNKMHHYTGIYLLQNHSTCFG
jgi:hypothetical protein